MLEPSPEIKVCPDCYAVSREDALIVASLNAALAICVYDDTRPAAGLLHLRYVATAQNRPLDLTDNTLSSGLLLMDRFCKELRAAGGRKQSWRVRIFGHTPPTPGIAGPATTVLDLVRAYFADGRLPVECQEMTLSSDMALGLAPRSPPKSAAESARVLIPDLQIRLSVRDGRIWTTGDHWNVTR